MTSNLEPLSPPTGPPERYTSGPLPDYRHVPGLTPHPVNHPEGHSHGVEELEPSPVCVRLPDAWRECDEYLRGVDLFNRAYLWEAHEAWEKVWIGAGKSSRPAQFAQGLVQVSACLLRSHMRTHGGAANLRRRAESRFQPIAEQLAASGESRYMGVDLAEWRAAVDAYLDRRGAFPFLNLARDPSPSRAART